ncbi:glycosyltransferase family 39 protein [Desulfopila sp. IMCC35006]|uniref:ArnT family glycosyltransferase n=1 Tax=Desulfopila sp. IMCC35006 TaxID=2569542 RepID=UPI00142F0D86|nr:glycosyltransferase family 39 protein [Desulfopila sp. IMCC35006]
MNLDLLYYVSLLFNNDILPKYIHYFFALLTGFLIYRYVSPRLSKAWGLFGATFFLTLPVIVRLSTTVYVDLGLVAFSTASLLLLLEWGATRHIRYLIFAGICCGLAAGTKYNGIVSIVLLTLLSPIIYTRFQNLQNCKQDGGAPILYMAVFLLAALLSYSPWLVRNFIYTGNPIYPLYNSVFIKSQPVNSTQEMPRQKALKEQKIKETEKKDISTPWTPFSIRKVLYGEKWWQAILLPVRYFFEGQDDDPRYFDGKLNPFLFIFIFVAFYYCRYSPKIRLELHFLFIFAWLYFFFSFFQGALRIRYIATSLPAFVILATFGVNNVFRRLQSLHNFKEKYNIFVLLTIISIIFIYNGNYLYHLFIRYQPLSYLKGQMTRNEYLTKYLPEYSVIQYTNSHLTQGDKILAIYLGGRGYYFDFPVRFDLLGKEGYIGTSVINSSSAEEVYDSLSENGFTHLFIRMKLFSDTANQYLTVEEIGRLNDFLLHFTKQLNVNDSYGLFELHHPDR